MNYLTRNGVWVWLECGKAKDGKVKTKGESRSDGDDIGEGRRKNRVRKRKRSEERKSKRSWFATINRVSAHAEREYTSKS